MKKKTIQKGTIHNKSKKKQSKIKLSKELELEKKHLKWFSTLIVILLFLAFVLLFLLYFSLHTNVLPYTTITYENSTIVGRVVEMFKW